MKRISAIFFTAMFVAWRFSASAAASGDEILGIWHAGEGKGDVQVFKENGRYCAKIISLKDPNWPAGDPQAGHPKTDRLNPKPDLRQRLIIGMQFMSDFAHTGNNLWTGGRVYDPESGKTYKCKMFLLDKDHLQVHGYIGVSMLGRTVVWTRANYVSEK